MTNAKLSKELNFKQYSPEYWHSDNNSFSMQQKETMLNTIDIIKNDVIHNGITARFNGKELYFQCLAYDELNVKLAFKDLTKKGCDGEHDPKTNTITINKKLANQGPIACGTLYHEMTHAIQLALVAHKNEYAIDSDEYKYLHLLEHEIKHKKIQTHSFGLSINRDVYMPTNAAYVSYAQKELIDAFYNLQLSERHAFSVGYTARNCVIDTIEDAELQRKERNRWHNQQDKYVRVIRNHYMNQSLTYDQVFALIDNAKLNLIQQTPPSKYQDLEAMVTMDMAECLKIQTSGIFRFRLDANELKRRNDTDVRDSYLMNYYKEQQRQFINPNKASRIGDVMFLNNSPYCNEFVSLETLNEMPEEVQIQNPKAIALAICIMGEEAKQIIKNEDMFYLWCASSCNDLSVLTMTRIEEEMGPMYSKTNLQIYNEEIQKWLKESNNIYSQLNDVNIDYINFDYGFIR